VAQVAAVIAGAAVLLGVSLGAAPLERAEIYFVDAARAMVETGDYVVPRYEGEPFFDKPPLTYWLMAGAFRAFGATLAAARAVPVAAALLLLAATAWLGTRAFDRRTGAAAAAILASTLLFLAFGRVAMSDMLLALLSTTAVALGLEALGTRGARLLLLGVALGIVLGLGFLTKGPIAVLLPGLGVLAFWWAARRRPPLGPLALAVVAFAVVGLSWFVVVYRRMGPAPLEYFFLRENLERFAGETYDAGRSPFYYLYAYLAVGLPWSLLLPRAAWRLPRGERTALLWLGLMLVPLSLARGKIDYYLLPLAPAASLVVARWLAAVPWNAGDVRWARAAAVAFALVALAIPWLAAHVPTEWLPGGAAQVLLLLVAAGSAVAALAAARRPTPGRLGAVLGGGAAAVFLVLGAFHLPAFRAAQPNLALTADVLRERGFRPDVQVALCDDPARVQRDVLFAARLAALERCDLWSLAASSQPFLLVLSEAEFESLARAPNVRPIAGYRALPATALTLGGLVAGVAPETIVLAANFETDDPVAEVKRKKDRKRLLREDDPDLP
jgi:4-amino-4-deoxy-L-arabinose transferase-like glycosyltransferase